MHGHSLPRIATSCIAATVVVVPLLYDTSKVTPGILAVGTVAAVTTTPDIGVGLAVRVHTVRGETSTATDGLELKVVPITRWSCRYHD